jgi:hypothetical protein
VRFETVSQLVVESSLACRLPEIEHYIAGWGSRFGFFQ